MVYSVRKKSMYVFIVMTLDNSDKMEACQNARSDGVMGGF